jgi:hypothetical protein
LARANHRSRPYGEASIALARALLQTGQPRPALALLEAELTRGWDAAETFVVLSHARAASRRLPMRRWRKPGNATRSEKMYR